MPKVTEAHVEARRSQILQAACRCFGRKGLHRTTIRDICDEADLSTGAVYGYFRSKDEIFEALAALGRENTRSLLFSSGSAGPSPAELARVVGNLLRLLETETARESAQLDLRLWGEALEAPRIREQFRQGLENLIEPFAELVRSGQQRGEIRRAFDPRSAARVLIALGLGFQVQMAMEPDAELAGCSEVTTALLTGTFAVARTKEASKGRPRSR